MLHGILARKASHVALIILLGALVYANAVNVPFHFDDNRNIAENPIIKDFSYFTGEASAEGFIQYKAFRSRYIGFLTLFLNYRFGGLDVAGYHIVNILIHIINALLVYALVMLSFRTPVLSTSQLSEKRHWMALLAAALFVVHPVNTQAVTYIVQRFASLVALFYLGSMVCYISARISKSKRHWVFYVGSLVLAVLAMKTKENAFTLPMAVALYEFMFFRGEPLKRRALLLAPLMLTMLIIPLPYFDLGRPVSVVMSDVLEKTNVQHIPRDLYLLTELRVIITYLRLLVLPMNQTLDYAYPIYTSVTQGPVLLSLALIGAFVVLAGYLFQREDPSLKLAAFGIGFFFLALIVESGLALLQPIYEHRVYLPSIGLLIMFSISVISYFSYAKHSYIRVLGFIATGACVGCLSIAAVERNSIWESDLSLWQDVVNKAPMSKRALSNVGLAYYKETKELNKARKHFNRALELDPTDALAHYNLGVIYGDENKWDSALKHLDLAIRSNDRLAIAYEKTGYIYSKNGELSRAVFYLNKALELNPGLAGAHNGLGTVYRKMGKFVEAERHYRQALSLWPRNIIALNNLGITFSQMGKLNDAIAAHRQALEQDPSFVETYVNMGITYSLLEQYAEAIENFRQALELSPDDPDIHFNLALAYLKAEKKSLAKEELVKVLALTPSDQKANQILTTLDAVQPHEQRK